MSSRSAPCSAMALAWAIAVAGSRNLPPSEKESGVTLRMPITTGRPRPSRPDSAVGPGFCSGFGLVLRISASAMDLALRSLAGPVKRASAQEVLPQKVGAENRDGAAAGGEFDADHGRIKQLQDERQNAADHHRNVHDEA